MSKLDDILIDMMDKDDSVDCKECMLSKKNYAETVIGCTYNYKTGDGKCVSFIQRSHEWIPINNKWYCPNCGHVTEFRNSACSVCRWAFKGETDEEEN